MATPANPKATAEANVRCPYCAETISAAARKCKHCGEFLDQALRQERVPTPVIQQPQKAWNPGAAAVLSLVLPGAGQMYKGSIGVGLCWLVGVACGYGLFIVPGIVLHIACVYNAYSYDPNKKNDAKVGATAPPRTSQNPQNDVLYKAGRVWSWMTK
jgi:TM2 domain-containing membrane protein YozV